MNAQAHRLAAHVAAAKAKQNSDSGEPLNLAALDATLQLGKDQSMTVGEAIPALQRAQGLQKLVDDSRAEAAELRAQLKMLSQAAGTEDPAELVTRLRASGQHTDNPYGGDDVATPTQEEAFRAMVQVVQAQDARLQALNEQLGQVTGTLDTARETTLQRQINEIAADHGVDASAVAELLPQVGNNMEAAAAMLAMQNQKATSATRQAEDAVNAFTAMLGGSDAGGGTGQSEAGHAALADSLFGTTTESGGGLSVGEDALVKAIAENT